MTRVMTADEWNKQRARSNEGRAAYASGRGFEADLEWTHGKYRAARIADVFKLPVTTQAMPKGWLQDPRKSGVCRILSERQRADYVGTLGPQAGAGLLGRSVLMEAKYTSERAPSLPIIPAGKKSGSGLKAHQLESLANCAEFGAIGVIVWRNGHERLVFMPPVVTWAWAKFRLGQVKRLHPVDAIEYHRDGGAGGDAIEDWLSPVLRVVGKQAS